MYEDSYSAQVKPSSYIPEINIMISIHFQLLRKVYFRSVLQMIFVLFQMYFVFLNQKVKCEKQRETLNILKHVSFLSDEYLQEQIPLSARIDAYDSHQPLCLAEGKGNLNKMQGDIPLFHKVLVLETLHGIHFDHHHDQVERVVHSKQVSDSVDSRYLTSSSHYGNISHYQVRKYCHFQISKHV